MEQQELTMIAVHKSSNEGEWLLGGVVVLAIQKVLNPLGDMCRVSLPLARLSLVDFYNDVRD